MSLSDPIHRSSDELKSARGDLIHLSAQTRTIPREITARINPSRSRRLLILLSFPLVFLLGVPFWWYTTSIERLGLPLERIAALEAAPPTTVKSTILLTAFPDAYPPPPPGVPGFTSKQVCESLGDAITKSTDAFYRQGGRLGTRWWDFVFEDRKVRGRIPRLHIHIEKSESANASFPLRPYVQAPNLGLSAGGVEAGTLVVPIHPKQVTDRDLREHLKMSITDAILNLYPSSPPDIPLRALKYSPDITLSFVLLNEDAAAGEYVKSWDIETVIREHFTPHLQPLRPIFNFTIESQILYHAPLSFEPIWGDAPAQGEEGERRLEIAMKQAEKGDKDAEEVAKALIVEEEREKAWLVDEEMMKVFVNSEKWTLDSGVSQNPVLRFLLFIPSPQHRPLMLTTPSSASSLSFLLPQFGGVVILNPPSHSSTHPNPPSFHLNTANLKPSFHLFTQHLYSLLALPTRPDKVYTSLPPDPRSPPSGLMDGFNRWQLEAVARQRMAENELEARKTLSGIGRLVGKIKEMKVGEGVRDMVLGAVERLEKMKQTKDPLQAFVLSRDAVKLANQAFFDPSMMGLLYFPNEHKFAVYTPLFAPVAVPILVGLLKELVGWIKRRKAKRAQASSGAGNTGVDEQEDVKPSALTRTATSDGETEEKGEPSESGARAIADSSIVGQSSGRTLRARTRRQVDEAAG